MMTAREAYEKAEKSGWSQKLEDVVIDSGEPDLAYFFAHNIRGANIPKLEQVVIDSGEPDLAYFFAHNIRGANIPKLEQVVIDSGNTEEAYWFARNVEGANISDLINFVLIYVPHLIKDLFKERPDLKRKYELGEIRKQIRRSLLEK